MRSQLTLIPLAITSILLVDAKAHAWFGDTPPHATPVAPAPSSAAPPITATKLDPATQPDRSPVGVLTPIASTGIPAIYNKMYDFSAEELKVRAHARQYAKQISTIKHEHFGKIKVQDIRDKGIEQLQEFVDPAAFRPMIEELAKEGDDVRLAVLDHFSMQGEEGQGALGWVAIFDHDLAIRNEALKRMVTPAAEPVKFLLNGALRSENHDVVNAAATIAGALNVTSTIPLLIFGQAAIAGTGNDGTGDLAWIAIQTQRAYVQNLIPIVGSNSGAYQPVIGVVSEGVVMRVVDAVVIEYRTPVHSALVAMTSHDWGNSTEYLSYNVQAWWDWYNTEYVPFKNEQAAKAAIAGS